MNQKLQDRPFMIAKDIFLLVIAAIMFYYAFIDRQVGQAKESVSRQEVKMMISEESPWIKERSGVITQLEAVNKNLDEIKMDIREMNSRINKVK